MHPNQIFHDADAQKNIAFARETGFGVLAVNGPDGPLLSHVPFLLNDDGTSAELHLVRSNPIARALETPTHARIAVTGPDGYVSPDWYGVPDQVPTWNYVAVHLTGVLEMRPAQEMRELLDRQAAFLEARLAPKPAWTTDKMTPEVLEKMMRQILPFRFKVTGIDGTWKLGQNKSDTVRMRAAGQMDAYGYGSEPRVLAALMRGVPPTQ